MASTFLARNRSISSRLPDRRALAKALSALGSAPLASKRRTIALSWRSAASYSAEVRKPDCRALTLAPLASSRRATSTLPSRAANIRGGIEGFAFLPSQPPSTSAPLASSIRATAVWPRCAALCSGVNLSKRDAACTSAPLAISNSAIRGSLLAAASCSGVRSSSPLALTSAPAARSNCTISRLLPRLATWSGVAPLASRSFASLGFASNSFWTAAVSPLLMACVNSWAGSGDTMATRHRTAKPRRCRWAMTTAPQTVSCPLRHYNQPRPRWNVTSS